MPVSLAATKAPFPGIYTPGGSATPKFSGHHRYRDPTPFIIPTAGFVHFPEEMRKSDSGLNSGESKLSKVGEGSHAETDSSGKESEGSNSQTSEKEKNVVLNAASSMDNKNSEDVDLSNTEVIEDLQSKYKSLRTVCVLAWQ